MDHSQRRRKAPAGTGSEFRATRRTGLLVCAAAAAFGIAHWQAVAQTPSGITAAPAGLSSFQTPLSPVTPLSPPGQAWPTVQSSVPALWTPRGAVAAPGPTAPPFLLTGAIDMAQGYTTNATQTSTGSAKSDAFTRGQVDLGLHYDSLRLKLDAHSSTSGFYFYNQHDANQFNQNLNLVANSEVVPDHLFMNFNAFAAPVTLSRVGQISATPGLVSNSNSQQSYGYSANPVYKTHFGNYLTSETSFNESQLFFQQPSVASTDTSLPVVPLGNTTSSTISQGFSSGPYFGRLRWNVTAAYSNMEQPGQSQRETLGIASGAYAINRVFSVLATFGYDQIRTSFPLAEDLSPLVALGGVRFAFGPKFTAAAAAGVSHGFPTYLGSLNWNVTGTFQIIGSLTQSISSSQGNILNNLSTLAVSSEGVFSDAQSYYWQSQQQALNPQFATISPVPIGGLAFTNGLARDRQANVSFVHTDERNTYMLSLFGDLQDQLSAPVLPGQTICATGQPASCVSPNATSSLYGARVSASRQLRRALSGYVGLSYSVANEFGGSDRIFTAGAGLNYSLSPKTDAYVSTQYVYRRSIDQFIASGPPSDASVIVGMRHRL